MSRIEVTVGEAAVHLTSVEETFTHGGDVFVHYRPKDLMDATCAALLAVNTPQSVAWAHALYELTAGNR